MADSPPDHTAKDFSTATLENLAPTIIAVLVNIIPVFAVVGLILIYVYFTGI